MAYIIAGLGNPGAMYQFNRHNVGFLFIDQLVKHFDLESNREKKFGAECYKLDYCGERYFLVKPLDFMNNSGIAIKDFLSFYKINSSNLIVCFDDLDLEFLNIRYRKNGGSGGHNGLKSIDNFVANDYSKIKFGIGRPERKEMVSSYVLSDFTKSEIENLEILFGKLLKNIDLLLKFQLDKFIMAVKNGL